MPNDIDTLITVLILAGGQGKRLGGIDKGLLSITGQPLIAFILGKLKPLYPRIIISANRNLDSYQQFEVPVLVDNVPGYPGPLTGINTALQQVTTPYLLVIPCDMPHFPLELGRRLLQRLKECHVQIAVAHDGERLQPLCCLMSTSLSNSLTSYLAAGKRQVGHWIMEQPHVVVDFSDEAQAFINLNTLKDIDDFLTPQP